MSPPVAALVLALLVGIPRGARAQSPGGAAAPDRPEPTNAEPAKAKPRRAKPKHPKSPHARPRTKSHRWRSAKATEARAAPARARGPAPKMLAPGRWRPEVSRAIESVIAARGKDSEGYSKIDPPVAVIELEDVAMNGDIAEALFHRLVTRAEFKFSAKFWSLVPPQYGGARLRAAFEGFRGQPAASWDKNPYYHMYRKAFFNCHDSICREWGEQRCAQWRVQLLTGFPESELRPYAQEAIAEELQKPVGVETVEEYPGDQAPAKIRTGLRSIREMQNLCLRLKDQGFDVWAMSDAYQWVAEEMLKEYGVHPSRVLGIRSKVTEDGMLTAEILTPVPEGAGQAEAVTMFIGRSPAISIGDKESSALLDYGRGLRVMIADAEDAGVAVPGPKKWLVQPRFSPERGPQEREFPQVEAPPPATPPEVPEAGGTQKESQPGGG